MMIRIPPVFPLRRLNARSLMLTAALGALAACTPNGGMDWDMRGLTGGALDTSGAARGTVERRPRADDRGVIAYPSYQVAVARRGDTVGSLANRLGMGAEEVGRYNALKPDDLLREGEIIALPRRVDMASAPGGAPQSGAIIGGTIAPAPVEVTAIATTALDRVGNATTRPTSPTAEQPGRHRVQRGETAYSVARLYGVNVKALADWNGLGPSLDLREGQYLLIPTVGAAAPRAADNTAPGAGSATPVPPSAAKPLPAEKTQPASAKPKETPASPNMGSNRTAASSSAFVMPADGKIIRPFVKGKTEGIDIAASAGATVRAAAAGEVVAITKDTGQVPILVMRHDGNILTVYAGIDAVKVKKGDKVQKGQAIAVVRNANPAFLHFEIRRGVEAVDPMSLLQ